MSSSLLPLAIVLFGGGYFLLWHRNMNPRAERMLWGAGVLFFIGWLFSLLNTENLLAFTVLYVIPLGLTYLIITIWPERKGLLWTFHGDRRYTHGVFLQVWWSLIIALMVFVLGCSTIYGFYFPNSIYPVHPSTLIPNPLGFYVLVMLTFIIGLGLVFQVWRFVRMLPPKK